MCYSGMQAPEPVDPRTKRCGVVRVVRGPSGACYTLHVSLVLLGFLPIWKIMSSMELTLGCNFLISRICPNSVILFENDFRENRHFRKILLKLNFRVQSCQL